MKLRNINLKQILSGTFWLIMAIHFVAFVAVGFVSGNWRLLSVFVPTLLLSVIIKYIISMRRNRQ